MMFALASIHRMSQTFFIQQNISLIYCELFFQQHFYLQLFFFMFTTIIYQKQYIFAFNLKNSMTGTLAVSSFILETTVLFQSS